MHGCNNNINGCLSVAVTRIGEPIEVSCHLVCTINKGDSRYEVFVPHNDDTFVLADGKTLKVLKDGIQI